MKKLILLTSLCVTAFVVAPIASANASFTGACHITGSATFTNKLEGLVGGITGGVTGEGYTFTANGGTCVDSAHNVYTVDSGTTVTGGTFTGSCFGNSESVADGEGALEVDNANDEDVTASFDLSFHAAAGVVGLEIGPDDQTESAESAPGATGAATFFTSTHKEPQECPSGVNELEFEANAAGTIG